MDLLHGLIVDLGISGRGNVTIFLLFLMIFGAMSLLILFFNSYLGDDRRAKSRRTIQRYREELDRSFNMDDGKKGGFRSRTQKGWVERVINEYSFYDLANIEKTKEFLRTAGWRSRDSVYIYLILKIIVPAMVGFLSFAYMYLTDQKSMAISLLICLCMMFVGYSGVETYAQRRVRSRYKSIEEGVPDMLDLLVICTEAGLSMQMAFKKVANEMVAPHPELADDLALTVVEMNFHSTIEKPFTSLAKRVDITSIRSITNIILQSLKFGTPLSRSLQILAEEYRAERLLKAEEKAARLPAIMTIPLALFILPVLFIVILGPAVLRTMDAMKDM